MKLVHLHENATSKVTSKLWNHWVSEGFVLTIILLTIIINNIIIIKSHAHVGKWPFKKYRSKCALSIWIW